MSGVIVDHKATLNRLAGIIEKEQNCATEIYSSGDFAEEINSVLEIARKKTNERFVVLIIGAFSSGKSSMINALIGEELLPHGFLPETAVLGELHYGKTKSITLFPKKGKWKSDAPFKLQKATRDEIAKYISLSSDEAINAREKTTDGGDSVRIDAKFEKMVIQWPLDILKDGVVLVDSPGINDPYSSDYIVNDYLPNADAIVYVMDSQHAYQHTDKTQLETINNIGRKNIITGYTFYDIVEKNTQKKPEELNRIRRTLINHMLKHTNLGEVSIHFLDSMGGLDAKLSNNPAEWRKSGFEGFENYIGQYLVEGKGKDQVRNMISTIIIQANKMAKDAARLNSAANQDAKELEQRISEAAENLKRTRKNAFDTGRNYRHSLENYLPEAERMTREFVTQKLPQMVDLENFEPETTLPDGMRKLWPFGEKGARAKAAMIQKECQEELIRRMNVEYKKWISTTLGDYIQTAVKNSAEEIRPDLQRIANELTNITDTISGYKQTEDSNAGSIALGVVYTFITGDFITGGMSAVYGARTMARGIVFQFGTGVGLGLLAAAGAPITLPVVAIALIGSSIAAILTGDNKGKVDRIKVQAVKDFRNSFADIKSGQEVDKMIDNIMTNVRKYIDDACTIMETALNEDITNTAQVIQQVIDNNNLSLEQKKEQVRQRNAAVEKLAELKEEALAVGKEYEITDVTVSAG